MFKTAPADLQSKYSDPLLTEFSSASPLSLDDLPPWEETASDSLRSRWCEAPRGEDATAADSAGKKPFSDVFTSSQSSRLGIRIQTLRALAATSALADGAAEEVAPPRPLSASRFASAPPVLQLAGPGSSSEDSPVPHAVAEPLFSNPTHGLPGSPDVHSDAARDHGRSGGVPEVDPHHEAPSRRRRRSQIRLAAAAGRRLKC